MINSELNMFRKQATPKSLRVIADFDREQEVIVSVDPDMISLVIRNLVSNAIKFSYKDADIELELRKNDRYARVSVRDHRTWYVP
ncbi:MAG: hypothetical protein K9G67_02035 [Bacteroidales bacterium]|nr:hypothetical protein [Bacteroidales bacterium]MCF8349552.1 hypothetical protein [Bacteroidales bacterium]MCF8375111.1 hypothetical protein [Bacteroidales bacterium]MCF8400018.1 hypothetical protein [Bacteroidales bacterium]